MNKFNVELDGKKLELYVKKPSMKELEDADRMRACKIAELIKSGDNTLLSRVELEDFLRKSKIWTDEDENKVIALHKKIESKLSELEKGGKKASEGRKICIEILQIRKDIYNAMIKRFSFEDATIESMAERRRDEYLIYLCTMNAENNKRFFEALDEVGEDQYFDVRFFAQRKISEYIYGNAEDVEKTLPENKWLSRFGYLDEKMILVDRKTKQPVDWEGNLIPQLSEEEKAKLVEKNTTGIKEETPFIDDETGEPIVA